MSLLRLPEKRKNMNPILILTIVFAVFWFLLIFGFAVSERGEEK